MVDEKVKIAVVGIWMMDDEEDIDSDEMIDEKGISAESDIRREPIVPTYKGFQATSALSPPTWRLV